MRKRKEKTKKEKQPVYIPTVKYVYPEKTDEQIIKVEEKRKVKLDTKYYQRLTKVVYKIGQFFFKIPVYLIAYPLVYIRYHMKVEGRENIKKHRKELKKSGFITVSNHVFLWDCIALCASVRMGLPNIPAWGKIISSKFGGIFSLFGVVPIPEERTVFRKFYEFMDSVFKQNKWVHIYPETGLWYYYVPIRPFKRGAGVFAYQYDKPIIPIGYSFRERKGIAKWFNKKDPLVTVHISEPIWPDKTLEKRESINDVVSCARMAIMKSVGIESEEENQRIMDENYKYEDGHFYTDL